MITCEINSKEIYLKEIIYGKYGTLYYTELVDTSFTNLKACIADIIGGTGIWINDFKRYLNFESRKFKTVETKITIKDIIDKKMWQKSLFSYPIEIYRIEKSEGILGVWKLMQNKVRFPLPDVKEDEIEKFFNEKEDENLFEELKTINSYDYSFIKLSESWNLEDNITEYFGLNNDSNQVSLTNFIKENSTALKKKVVESLNPVFTGENSKSSFDDLLRKPLEAQKSQ